MILQSRTSGLHSSLSKLVPRSVLLFKRVLSLEYGWDDDMVQVERVKRPGYGLGSRLLVTPTECFVFLSVCVLCNLYSIL